MAVFKRSEKRQLDRIILESWPIAYSFNALETENVDQWFVNHSYQVFRFDCAKWLSDPGVNFYEDFYQTLQFPDYCGYGLDSLRDCLLGELNISDDSSGYVLLFSNFDKFYESHRKFATEILDILVEITRYNLLFGLRLISILSVTNEKIKFEPVGGRIPARISSLRWKPENIAL